MVYEISTTANNNFIWWYNTATDQKIGQIGANETSITIAIILK